MRYLPALILCAFSTVARADSFTLSFNDGVDNLVTLDGDFRPSQNAYLIRSATGTIDGSSISLAPAGTFGSNNLLFYPSRSGSLFDGSGITFNLATNGTPYNLFYGNFNGVTGYQYSNFGEAIFSVNALTVTPGAGIPAAVTPEPNTLALIGSGTLGLLTAFRRSLPEARS